MKFSVRQDFDQSAQRVFDAVTDFAAIEATLRRRGADVRRLDPARDPGAGLAWDVAFDLRGKRREMQLEVTQFDRPETVRFRGEGEALEITVTMTVVALSQDRARVVTELEVKPLTMRARLMLQTAKLGKTGLDRKFAARVGQALTDLIGAAV